MSKNLDFKVALEDLSVTASKSLKIQHLQELINLKRARGASYHDIANELSKVGVDTTAQYIQNVLYRVHKRNKANQQASPEAESSFKREELTLKDNEKDKSSNTQEEKSTIESNSNTQEVESAPKPQVLRDVKNMKINLASLRAEGLQTKRK